MEAYWSAALTVYQSLNLWNEKLRATAGVWITVWHPETPARKTHPMDYWTELNLETGPGGLQSSSVNRIICRGDAEIARVSGERWNLLDNIQEFAEKLSLKNGCDVDTACRTVIMVTPHKKTPQKLFGRIILVCRSIYYVNSYNNGNILYPCKKVWIFRLSKKN